MGIYIYIYSKLKGFPNKVTFLNSLAATQLSFVSRNVGMGCIETVLGFPIGICLGLGVKVYGLGFGGRQE